MQIISTIALISINETLFLQLVSFLIFMFIMNRIMFQPLQSVINERNSYIDKLKSDIQDNETRIAELNQSLVDEQAAALKEANLVREELETKGTSAAVEILDLAGVEVQKTMKSAEKEVKKKMAAATEQIHIEAETIALIIMEKVLNRRIGQ